MNALVIGRHPWRVPPTLDQPDMRVLQGLQQRLRGRMMIIVAGKVHWTRRFLLEGLRIVVVPQRYGAVGFCAVASRQAFAWTKSNRRPRVIVASEVLGGLVAVGVKALGRVPFVTQLQGDVLRPGPEYGSLLKRTLVRKAAEIAVRRADGVRSLNETIATHARSVFPTVRTEVLGSRVDTARFGYHAPRRSIGSDGPQVVCVGTLGTLKNQSLLVRAVALAREMLPGIKLTLVGTGPEERTLRQLAAQEKVADVVVFLGQVSHDDLPAVLESSDIFVFPSRSEGQPRAVLEAMSAGVPVIASDIPGHRGFIQPEQTGLLCAPKDPRAWADAIVRLSSDTPLRAAISRNARALVEREHEFESQLDRFAGFIQAVAERADP